MVCRVDACNGEAGTEGVQREGTEGGGRGSATLTSKKPGGVMTMIMMTRKQQSADNYIPSECSRRSGKEEVEGGEKGRWGEGEREKKEGV
jgi:hypothetical protein